VSYADSLSPGPAVLVDAQPRGEGRPALSWNARPRHYFAAQFCALSLTRVVISHSAGPVPAAPSTHDVTARTGRHLAADLPPRYWRSPTPQARCQFVRSAEAAATWGQAPVPGLPAPAIWLRCPPYLLTLRHYGPDNLLRARRSRVMSDNLTPATTSAGVTLLAFGNAPPTIFSSLGRPCCSPDSGDASLALAPCLALAVLCTTVVAGASCPPPHQPGPSAVCFLGLLPGIRTSVTLVSRGSFAATPRRRHGHKGRHPHGEPRIGSSTRQRIMLTARQAGSYRRAAPLLPILRCRRACKAVGWRQRSAASAARQRRPAVHRTTSTAPSCDIDEDEDDVENVAEFRGGRADALSADVAVSRSLQSVDLATPPSASPPPAPPWLRCGGGGFSADSSLLVQLARRLAPIDLVAWREGGLAARLLELAKAPCLLPLSLAVPVVDDDQPLRGWCRPLNCLQLAVGPLVCLLASGLYSVPVPTADSQVLLLYILRSRAGRHRHLWPCANLRQTGRLCGMTAWLALGFITAVLIIYLVANEVVALLQAFGVLFERARRRPWG
uniref:PBPe domain-containing protein n=1 Tax=Macrostomum lignano TaxID=282301 RepID=A0A1I8FN97_9PLAT